LSNSNAPVGNNFEKPVFELSVQLLCWPSGVARPDQLRKASSVKNQCAANPKRCKVTANADR
jgi:hypothetical protein